LTEEGYLRYDNNVAERLVKVGEAGDPIVLEIDCLEGRRHLPMIGVQRAAQHFCSQRSGYWCALVALSGVIVVQIVKDRACCYGVAVGIYDVNVWILVS
jgi:hypothetical protein